MRPTETNIAICGHSKHGKSTVAGRLLYEMGSIPGREMERARAEAVSRGKDFNEFSMIFLRHRTDTFGSGDKGLPEDPSRTVFPERGRVTLEDGRQITYIDTPGHLVFLEHIIYGIHLADMAILVVEAGSGVQEGTVEVARILESFAVPIIAVLVTKMDEVGYSEAPYLKTRNAVWNLLAQVPGFGGSQDAMPPIVPVSALGGVGFRRDPERMGWYDGLDVLSLAEHAYAAHSPAQRLSVRFAVEGPKEVYSPQGVGTVLVGGLETGRLLPGSELRVEPISTREGRNIVLRARSVQRARALNEKRKSGSESEVEARAVAAVAVSHMPLPEARRLFKHGAMLGPTNDPPCVASEILADIIFFSPDTVYVGRNYGVTTNGLDGGAKIVAIIDPSDSRTSESRYRPQVGQAHKIRLRFEYPMCIESAPDLHRLTLFVLRDHNSVVACGRCVEIVE